jgi:hypothetical protein
LLLDKGGKPTPNYSTLKEYQQYLKKDDLLILKVPQLIFERRIPHGGKFIENEAYLADPVFDVLQRHGVGLVYSHWTWLP